MIGKKALFFGYKNKYPFTNMKGLLEYMQQNKMLEVEAELKLTYKDVLSDLEVSSPLSALTNYWKALGEREKRREPQLLCLGLLCLTIHFSPSPLVCVRVVQHNGFLLHRIIFVFFAFRN